MLKKTIFCVLCILSCSACVVPGVKDSMQNSQNGLVIGADYGVIHRSNKYDGVSYSNSHPGFNIGIYGSKLELGLRYRLLGKAHSFEYDYHGVYRDEYEDKVSYSQAGVYLKYLLLGDNRKSGLKGYLSTGVSNFSFNDKMKLTSSRTTYPYTTQTYEDKEDKDFIGISYGFGLEYGFSNGFNVGVYCESNTGNSKGKDYSIWGNVLVANMSWRFNFENSNKTPNVAGSLLGISINKKEIQPSNATWFHGASVVGNPSQSLNQQQTHKKIRQSNSWFGSSSVNYGNSWFAE